MTCSNCWCKHNWVERTEIIKEVLENGSSRAKTDIFYRSKFYVCTKCLEIKQEPLNKCEQGGLDDNQCR